MLEEETNAVIEAIKKYNLEIDDLFLYKLQDFRIAFEEDSVDE